MEDHSDSGRDMKKAFAKAGNQTTNDDILDALNGLERAMHGIDRQVLNMQSEGTRRRLVVAIEQSLGYIEGFKAGKLTQGRYRFAELLERVVEYWPETESHEEDTVAALVGKLTESGLTVEGAAVKLGQQSGMIDSRTR